MDPVIASVTTFLESEGFRFRVDEENEHVSFSVTANHGTFDVWVECNAGPHLFKVFVYAPVRIPEEQLAASVDLCNRLNWSCGPGTFEVGNEGRLRYRCSTVRDGAALTEDALRYLVAGAIGTIDHNLPALMSVCYGGVAPGDAFDMAAKKESA